ncbi:hypothetical protein EHQ76_10235 [Leptospira barantonii]|uniref:Uncharacterized protein n=1 Tax=Leptospira barantonii TaxID=2023184 RepID=A0A5F2BCP0_9LEPT|nr:hypothetical protein [Leptospira barantonii]TGM03137.1 hypothetical protein EHQ76_10235 [Leptospira barantonii]
MKLTDLMTINFFKRGSHSLFWKCSGTASFKIIVVTLNILIACSKPSMIDKIDFNKNTEIRISRFLPMSQFLDDNLTFDLDVDRILFYQNSQNMSGYKFYLLDSSLQNDIQNAAGDFKDCFLGTVSIFASEKDRIIEQNAFIIEIDNTNSVYRNQEYYVIFKREMHDKKVYLKKIRFFNVENSVRLNILISECQVAEKNWNQLFGEIENQLQQRNLLKADYSGLRFVEQIGFDEYNRIKN